MTTTVKYLDQPPAGWFPLDVMKADDSRKWDWCALMVDVPPDDLKHCHCKTAFLYVHPNDYKPDGTRTAQEAWVRIPGKYRSKDAAWDALHKMTKASNVVPFPDRHERGREEDDCRSFLEDLDALSPAQQRAFLATLRARWPMHRRDPATADFLNALAKRILPEAN